MYSLLSVEIWLKTEDIKNLLMLCVIKNWGDIKWKEFKVRPKGIILLFPEIRVTRKIFTRAAAIFFFNHFNFLNKIYIKALFFVEKQRVLPFIVWTKKRRFAWINLLWKFALTANSTDWTSPIMELKFNH